MTFFSYHQFYLAAKGNQYKNKRVVVEAIWRERNEKVRVEQIEQEQQARRLKNQEARKRKMDRRKARLAQEE